MVSGKEPIESFGRNNLLRSYKIFGASQTFTFLRQNESSSLHVFSMLAFWHLSSSDFPSINKIVALVRSVRVHWDGTLIITVVFLNFMIAVDEFGGHCKQVACSIIILGMTDSDMFQLYIICFRSSCHQSVFEILYSLRHPSLDH